MLGSSEARLLNYNIMKPTNYDYSGYYIFHSEARPFTIICKQSVKKHICMPPVDQQCLKREKSNLYS